MDTIAAGMQQLVDKVCESFLHLHHYTLQYKWHHRIAELLLLSLRSNRGYSGMGAQESM